MMNKLILFFLVGFTFLFSNPKWTQVYIGSEKFMVEIADTEEKKLKGLMYRSNIPDNYGMLFVFDREEIRSFWMKNTLTNLDIIFLDRNKQVINMFSNIPPCKTEPCPLYLSARPAQYVLELRGGRLKSLKLEAGDAVFFILEN